MLGRDLENARKPEEIERGSAGLEDETVWRHEERGLAGRRWGCARLARVPGLGNGWWVPQEIGVHVVAFDDREDLTLDDIEHLFPDCSWDGAQTSFVGSCRGEGRDGGGRGRKPDLEELLWALEGGGCLVIVGHWISYAIEGRREERDRRRRQRDACTGDDEERIAR